VDTGARYGRGGRRDHPASTRIAGRVAPHLPPPPNRGLPLRPPAE